MRKQIYQNLPIANHIRACIARAAGILSWQRDNEPASSDNVLSKRTEAPIEDVSRKERTYDVSRRYYTIQY